MTSWRCCSSALLLVSSEAAPGTKVQWDTSQIQTTAYAEGVQNLLQLVMINLITNAFQAMSDGGELTVIVGVGKDILIEIHNTGPGIPEAQLTKVFDPFFTLRNDSRRSGLGLFVSHSIVQQHGGTIAVRTIRKERRFPCDYQKPRTPVRTYCVAVEPTLQISGSPFAGPCVRKKDIVKAGPGSSSLASHIHATGGASLRAAAYPTPGICLHGGRGSGKPQPVGPVTLSTPAGNEARNRPTRASPVQIG